MRTRRDSRQQFTNSEIEECLAQGTLPKSDASKLVLTNWPTASHLFRDFLKPGWSPKKRRLAKQLFDSGYLQWPRKIQALIRGRSVLDFGCGRGLHPLGYIAMGAAHAVGFDPFVDPGSKSVKSKTSGRFFSLDTALGTLGDYFERVRFTDDPTVVRNLAPYDCIVLHNVTEHLQNLPNVFDEVQSLLAPSGLLVFHHHNFYSWDGHHAQPKTEDQIDLTSPAHTEVVDWAHIDFSPPPNHAIVKSTLNRITLDELRAETEERFSILLWREISSPKGRGLGRFSKIPKSIRKRHELRDLTIKNVLAVAKPKP